METTEKAGEEECVGVAITPEEPIKDPAVTLEETVHGEAQLLLAPAAASGECVLQPAKAWLHLCSSNTLFSTLKLKFIPLRVSPLPSCLKYLFFPFFFFLPGHVRGCIFLL